MSNQDFFTCPGCKQAVNTQDLDAHIASGHKTGIWTPPAPQQPPQYQQYPQQQQYPQRPRIQRWQDVPISTETWPHGNLPQRPPTRDLPWHQQIMGMFYWYRTGLVYFGIIVMVTTAILLTEPWRYW